MKNILKKNIRQLIIDTIKEELSDVSIIYLFGSYAKGCEHKSSDIDIAILGSRPNDNVKLWMLAQKLSILCGYDIDLVDLRKATAVMRIQIVAEGEHLFNDGNPESELFEDFIFSDYARLNEERQGILDDISSRGNVYG